MEFLKSLRMKIGRNILRRKSLKQKRKTRYSSFSSVKNIGIVWDASDPAEFRVLSEFHKKMEERKISVSVLGYYPGHDLPATYTAISFLTCLKRDDLGFPYLPGSGDAETFIKKGHDVLIDLNFKNILPLQYISSLSLAHFKVGIKDAGSDPVKSPFDLMIDMKKHDIKAFLDEAIRYLEMINTGDGKAA